LSRPTGKWIERRERYPVIRTSRSINAMSDSNSSSKCRGRGPKCFPSCAGARFLYDRGRRGQVQKNHRPRRSMNPSRNLRAGIFLPPFPPADEDPTLLMERDFGLIEYLEKLGFAEAWIGEHHSGGFEIYGAPDLFIASAAARTKRIMLGTGVLSLPYHHPF